MDVTMMSYENTDMSDPFTADYSVIQPSNSNKQSTAWNVSGFGGFGSAQTQTQQNQTMNSGGDMNINHSIIAQAGTPGKVLNNVGMNGLGPMPMPTNGYDYDSMYNDINLRGDHIGQVLKTQNTQFRQKMKSKESLNAYTSQAPMSPFSRQRSAKKIENKPNSNKSVVFTSMGVPKSQFSAYYMEQSIDLYFALSIDGLIANWAESMRWWLGECVKNRNLEIAQSDSDICRIFSLLSGKYGLKRQLSEFVTPLQRESFVLENESQLSNVAKQENNTQIMHIIQKRKHLRTCLAFVVRNHSWANTNNEVTEYALQRMQTLSNANNLRLYKWNMGGTAYNNLKNGGKYPCDAQLLMAVFCRYMDDALCPAIKFSEKHFIQIEGVSGMKKMDNLYKQFKDIAIICVTSNNANKNGNNNNFGNNFGNDLTEKDSLPYFFIAFNKKKFEKQMRHFSNINSASIQKPKHFLYNAWNNGIVNGLNDSLNQYWNSQNSQNSQNQNRANQNELKDEESDEGLGQQRSSHTHTHTHHRRKGSVGTWFPQPGKDNLIHCITLFALFIHRYCHGRLANIALKDQGCTLLQPILK